MNATVYKSTGNWYQVKDDKGNGFNARLLGKFKMDGLTSTNPIAVGDSVNIEMEKELEGSVTITEIGKRKNYITRTSPANKHQHHIIASNLDQSLLFATLKDPKTSQGFIDRFLITSEAYHIPSIIVFNKSDLYRQKETDKFAEVKSIYEAIGYQVLSMSIEKGDGVEAVKNLLKDKVTLLSGHSGVGKSTFINAVFPELKLKTQDVSDWSGKGLHTTTFVDISKEELSHYFPEMRALINDCKFNNCMHLNEPGCAVKLAVEEGGIHMDRYISYCNILETINEKNY